MTHGPRTAPSLGQRRYWQRVVGAVVLSVATAALAPAPLEQTRGRGRGTPPAKRTEPAQPRPTKGEPRVPVLQGEEGLVRAYDAILDARFPQVEAELRRACPSSSLPAAPSTPLRAGPATTLATQSAPSEACHVLEATALWWQIQLDPDSRELDDEFSTSVDRAIRTTEAWTVRTPDDAEAWFYLGGAYAARVQWRVLREEKLAAARDGKRIKDALERALTLNPDLDDAYFGVGMYRYYADVAPAAARFLRFLLLLPGGDRKEGLTQMLRARSEGRLLRGEADYQLHVIYLWYERQTERALQLLDDLREQYPGNPLFPMQMAEIQDGYEHDLSASLETWRWILERARTARINQSDLAEVRARLGIARHLETLAETDDAIDQLREVIAQKPVSPFSSLALAYLRLGEAYDRLNARSDAIAAYRSAVDSTPLDDRHNVRRDAAERLRKAPNAAHAEAFRLSLEGLRKLEQRDLDAAGSALERSIALNPRDPIAHYRLGRVLDARRDHEGAQRQFESAMRDARACPPVILGRVHLALAQTHERLGARDAAISAYRTAATLFGAGDDTHRAASRALTRLSQ
jgi:tetratricopeptide (TPR) repeat protein